MKTYTICTNDIFHPAIFPNWDEFKMEYQETHDKEPSESELIEFIDTILNTEIDDVFHEIKLHEKNHGEKYYVVIASVQTWSGIRKGAYIFRSMMDTISTCLQDLDCFTIGFKNGRMSIDGIHHDGQNHFVIRELTEKGEDYEYKYKWDNKRSDFEVYETIFKSSKLSHKVSLFDEIWG